MVESSSCTGDNSLQQAQTASVSFGRFMFESLDWEKRSTFTHNRHMEEVHRYSKSGSVAEKIAYFEAYFKKIRPASEANLETDPSGETSPCLHKVVANSTPVMDPTKIPQTSTRVHNDIFCHPFQVQAPLSDVSNHHSSSPPAENRRTATPQSGSNSVIEVVDWKVLHQSLENVKQGQHAKLQVKDGSSLKDNCNSIVSKATETAEVPPRKLKKKIPTERGCFRIFGKILSWCFCKFGEIFCFKVEDNDSRPFWSLSAKKTKGLKDIPDTFPLLGRNCRHHWNQSVHSLSLNVRKMFYDLFKGNEEEVKERFETTWRRIEEVAAKED